MTTDQPTAPPKIRDAASLILVRRDSPEPRVLMGMRGAGARFMPSKFVFPGGALDPSDTAVPLPGALPEACARRLDTASPPGLGRMLALAALRETFEEAGLAIGSPDPAAAALGAQVPAGWQGFFARGVVPRLDRLRFVFRAITPPSRPVRFDARFFMAEAGDVAGDPDDFSAAEDELSHLQWITLHAARSLDLPFITAVVLAEVEARLAQPDWPAARPVPFFRHDEHGAHMDGLA
jgi:8-oxo-dGTP pyrophosphatase MutT (NUDIX family)